MPRYRERVGVKKKKIVCKLNNESEEVPDDIRLSFPDDEYRNSR